MNEHISGLEALLMMDFGYFITRERLRELTQALMYFFNSMVASGIPLLTLPKDYGLIVCSAK